MTFRLAPEYEIQEVNIERGHKEYRVICTLKSMGNGSFVGQGVGCCSTMESKYRFRGGARKCPKCGKETIIMGKKFKPTDPEPGWLCWTKKGGCGATWSKDAPEIAGQSIEKVENENPADHYNTVLKMAKKRAFVDATITATAASDIFTQDIGDDESEIVPENAQTAPQRAASPSPTIPPHPAKQNAATATQRTPTVPPKAPEGASEACKRRFLELLSPLGTVASEYMRKAGYLMDNETLADLPLRHVPATKSEFDAAMSKIQAFVDGANAVKWNLPPQAPRIEAAPVATTQPVPASTTPHDDEWWRDIVVPVPHKNQKRDDYLKNPDSIGSLFDARHDDEDARKRLFGFVNHYEPKGWTKRDGTQMPPSAADLKFREALDAFADWEEKHGGDSAVPAQPEPEDEIPF